jgi:2-hydroxy-3-keto-5-methylthiopentenyl-1-phosphate phosphatase
MSDNIIAIMKHFDPPGWDAIVKDMMEGRKSLHIGVSELFAMLPSSMEDEIKQYVLETAGIRPGFQALLDWCKREQVEFIVVSGGIDFFLYPLIEPFAIPRDHIYCNESSFAKPNIEIIWPHTCDEYCDNDCGMCKTRVIRRYPASQYTRILIGDSLTDFEGSKLADHVFARSHLLERCRETHVPHTPYETFFDVIEGLNKRISKKGSHEL